MQVYRTCRINRILDPKISDIYLQQINILPLPPSKNICVEQYINSSLAHREPAVAPIKHVEAPKTAPRPVQKPIPPPPTKTVTMTVQPTTPVPPPVRTRVRKPPTPPEAKPIVLRQEWYPMQPEMPMEVGEQQMFPQDRCVTTTVLALLLACCGLPSPCFRLCD